MSEQTTGLLNTALQLPEADRAWLAEQLLGSLPPETEAAIDDAFLAELERRAAEAEKDPSVLVPWSAVKQMT
jgi:putative addiction module component (TIGR02574 family)